MKKAIPLHCPACTEPMAVTELTCPACETKVQGFFDAPGLHRLGADQLQFVEVFLRCRGNIKEVERDLGISYPTVRARLDQVVQAMGYTVPASPEVLTSVEQILSDLEDGALTFDEALVKIKEAESNHE